MAYFDVENFLQGLTTATEGKYKLENRTKQGEPLKYKVSSSPTDFGFIYFEVHENKVRVALDFGITASEKFIDEIKNLVGKLV